MLEKSSETIFWFYTDIYKSVISDSKFQNYSLFILTTTSPNFPNFP